MLPMDPGSFCEIIGSRSARVGFESLDSDETEVAELHKC
jgi:hypothetical protein